VKDKSMRSGITVHFLFSVLYIVNLVMIILCLYTMSDISHMLMAMPRLRKA